MTERAIPKLLLITDGSLGQSRLVSRLESALSAVTSPGEIAVQHRHPGATGRAFYEEALVLQALCTRVNTPLFINGRLDIALALNCHLHLPASSLPVAEYVTQLPGERWISTSVHHADELPRARGASFVLLSPVFAPKSKPHDTRAPLGLDGFNALRALTPCPVFALGGIDASNASLLPAGCGVATVSTVLHSDDPADAVRKLLRAMPGPSLV